MDDITHEQLPIDFDPQWINVLQRIKNQFGKKPSLETILFLIGINELGKVQKTFTKEEKRDLMHVAVCRLLSMNGYYQLAGTDDDGWPQWEASKNLPALTSMEQEIMLKKNIIIYFEKN